MSKVAKGMSGFTVLSLLKHCTATDLRGSRQRPHRATGI
jgi:hypothetical protein